MGILWPHSNTAPRTSADRRAPGALAYFYEAGTTTPRTTYRDADLTTPHTHPVVADAYGRFPAVFIDFGAYRERVKTAGNTQLWDTDDIPNPAPLDEATGVDADDLLTTGDVFFRFKNGTRTGAVRANGRTIGNTASSASERANPDCWPLYEELYNALSNAVCPVLPGRGANAAADFAANKQLTLPDLRGRTPFGLDDMGSDPAGRYGTLVAGYVDVNTFTTPGKAAGANTHTLTAAHIPVHTHVLTSVTVSTHGGHTHALSGGVATGAATSNGAHTHPSSTANSNGAHNHTPQSGGNFLKVVGGGSLAGPAAGTALQQEATTSTDGAHTHALTIQSDGAHTHTLSGITDTSGSHSHTLGNAPDNYGSGGAHNTLPGAVLGTWYIKL